NRQGWRGSPRKSFRPHRSLPAGDSRRSPRAGAALQGSGHAASRRASLPRRGGDRVARSDCELWRLDGAVRAASPPRAGAQGAAQRLRSSGGDRCRCAWPPQSRRELRELNRRVRGEAGRDLAANHTAVQTGAKPMADQTYAGDEIPPGDQVIELHVSELNQIFNSLDPSPFHEKDLDNDAEQFIVGWAKELPRDASLALCVYLDKPSVTPEMATT